MKQQVMVMCSLASALLAVSCATLHRSMSVGVGISMGVASTKTASLNSGALHCNIEGSVL